MENGNSILVGETRPIEDMVRESLQFLRGYRVSEEKLQWLGDGRTAERIVNILKERI